MTQQAKQKNKFFLILFVVLLLLSIALVTMNSSVAEENKQSTCTSDDGKSAVVCFNNVVLWSNQPTVTPIPTPAPTPTCVPPYARVGLFTSCSGTLKIRAYDAPMFPEEITATAQAELTTTPKP